MTQATTSCFTCSSFDEAKRLYTSLTEMLIRQFATAPSPEVAALAPSDNVTNPAYNFPRLWLE